MNSSPNALILELLAKSRASVFRTSDVAMITGETNRSRIVQRLRYGVNKGYLVSPSNGIYAKPEYSIEELACKLYVPSYISLETVLQEAGIIFQYSNEISLVSFNNFASWILHSPPPSGPRVAPHVCERFQSGTKS